MSSLLLGGVRLRSVSRTYKVVLERNLTLKETILRRRRVKARLVPALQDISFDLEPGTALGVVGANGAGKSTLLKVLAGIIPPDAGTVQIGGRIVSLLELGAGFHPDFTGRENVVLNASINGMTRREIERRMDAIIAFAELEKFIDAPIRTYSTGMYARLGFAVAAELEPNVLLLDEILAVGDATFQHKCLGRIADFQRNGVTIVLVSHSAGSIELVCNRAIWLSGGQMLADGSPRAVLEEYHESLVMKGASAQGAVESEDWRTGSVSAVRCTNGDHPADRFMSGERFTVDVDLLLREPLEVVVAFTIRTLDGALIAATDNRASLDAVPDDMGPHTVRFDVESLPLLEGRFAVDVELTTLAGDRLHSVERAVEFIVFAKGRGHGPVALDGLWTSDRSDVAPRVEGSTLP